MSRHASYGSCLTDSEKLLSTTSARCAVLTAVELRIEVMIPVASAPNTMPIRAIATNVSISDRPLWDRVDRPMTLMST